MSASSNSPASSAPCRYARRVSAGVSVGGTQFGGEAPIRLQSMANVSTMDTPASVAQAQRIIARGADLVRFTAQGTREAANLAHIRTELSAHGIDTPLVADIHFNPKAADEALEHIEKVRVNPGNYVDTRTATPVEWTPERYAEMHERVVERFGLFVERAKELGRAIRIGVNHGSLSERMVMLHGDTPEGMVQSALEYLDVCRQHDFSDVVISMKSSNTTVMTAAVRLLAQRLDELGYPAYPLHLGVTEAGEGEDGRIKSAVGIGSLLMDGIGDTIRVSLSEEPEEEIPVGRALVDYITSQEDLSSDALADAPTWNEYRQLSDGARRSTRTVGHIGGSELPVVAITTAMAETLPMADYQLTSEGLITPDGSQCIPTIHLTYQTLTSDRLSDLSRETDIVLILDTISTHPVHEWRLMLTRLRRHGIDLPTLLAHTYDVADTDTFRLRAAADAGTLLLDGWGNGLALSAPNVGSEDLVRTQFGILQATRLRMSKTEFISCPGCGRTLYNLQETIARVKGATSHLKGLKIGIMGCIVNGPGEMADADYGYVGAAPGKIDLYRGQECIRRGVDQAEAVDQLIDLIRGDGNWQDPE